MDGGLIFILIVLVILAGFAYGAYGRMRGTRGSIAERPMKARASTRAAEIDRPREGKPRG